MTPSSCPDPEFFVNYEGEGGGGPGNIFFLPFYSLQIGSIVYYKDNHSI